MLHFLRRLDAFLYRPRAAAVESLAPAPAAPHLAGSLAYALYLSLLLGVTLWSFVFYPEPLYYGLSGAALQKEVPSIIFANPWDSLAVMAATAVILFFIYTYLVMGLFNHAVMKRLSPGAAAPLKTYLSLYAYSLTPLLFWIPLMVLRAFFFERLINLRPLYPFFDWTIPNALHFFLTALLIGWMLFIQARLNQAAFQTSAGKASLPALAQAALLAVLSVIPAAFNEQLFNAFKDTLA